MIEMDKPRLPNTYGYLKFLLECRPSKTLTDEQIGETDTGVILNFIAVLFGGYEKSTESLAV